MDIDSWIIAGFAVLALGFLGISIAETFIAKRYDAEIEELKRKAKKR